MPGTISVLIADNDPDDRDFFKAALAQVAIPTTLHEVSDGAELMDFLRKQGKYINDPQPLPDIVFLDLNMPKVDGLSALEKIRREPGLAELPVYILTTSYNLSDLRRCNLAGCHGFFTKPHLQSRMVQQLTKALGPLADKS